MPTPMEPCPWCGCKPTVVNESHVAHGETFYDANRLVIAYRVGCQAKHCPMKPATKTYEDREMAVAVWNSRGKATVKRINLVAERRREKARETVDPVADSKASA